MCLEFGWMVLNEGVELICVAGDYCFAGGTTEIVHYQERFEETIDSVEFAEIGEEIEGENVAEEIFEIEAEIVEE